MLKNMNLNSKKWKRIKSRKSRPSDDADDPQSMSMLSDFYCDESWRCNLGLVQVMEANYNI